MPNPFQNLSKRKFRKLADIFYLRDKSRIEGYRLPFVVYEKLLQDYKTYDLFEKHLITITHENDISKDFYNMALHFKKAARESAEFLVKDSEIGKLDTVFFSVAYMYRQSIELAMKAHVFQLIEDETEQKKFMNDVGHDLISIFEIIESYLEEQISIQYSWLKELLFNVSKIDRASDSFRYPFRITKDIFLNKYEFEYVFKERKDICLIKLINKFEIAFALIEELYKLNDFNSGGSTDNFNSAIYKDYSAEFLEEGGHYYAKSVIGYEYNKSEIYLYVHAYRKSADYLYKKALDTMDSDNDSELAATFYFPICYLYRNAIELALKNLCFLSSENNEALEVIHGKKHKLESIWKHIKKSYPLKFNFDIPLKYKEEIDKALKIIHEADPTSSKFRYPIDKNLEYYQNNSQLHLAFDYYHLRHCLEIIEALFYHTQDCVDNLEMYYE